VFRRILVPIDGSPPSNRGLEEAIALAKNQGARLCLLHVIDELLMMPAFDASMYVPESYRREFIKTLQEEGRKLLANAAATARRRDINAEPVMLQTVGHRVADLVIKQAKKWRADVIVLGTHGRRGVARVLMGSDAEMVVRESPVPVLLVRGPPTRRKRRRRS
jgi:nucleotide-binding universal stress UspA family protein